MSSAHVPKFGNWEEKDIPYTRYFENARRDRIGSFNPNDPEDNPEAFLPKHTVQQQHSGKKQIKSSSQKANIDPPRISAKINSYTDRSNSNASVSHQSNNVPLFSKSLINAVAPSSIDSNDKGSVHPKPTNTAPLNEVKERKQTGATKFSAVSANTTATKSRKAMKRASSKKWCCLFTKTWE